MAGGYVPNIVAHPAEKGLLHAGTAFVGNPRVFGRIYMGMNGRGIVYGDIPHSAT